MAILEVKGLKKSFGANEVLKGIDFELNRGDVLAIIGSLQSFELIMTITGGQFNTSTLGMMVFVCSDCYEDVS